MLPEDQRTETVGMLKGTRAMKRPALVFAAVLALLRRRALMPPLRRRTTRSLPGGSSKEPVSIDAAKLDYFDKDQKLVYSGAVVATQGQSRLQASVLVDLPRAGDWPLRAASRCAAWKRKDR